MGRLPQHHPHCTDVSIPEVLDPFLQSNLFASWKRSMFCPLEQLKKTRRIGGGSDGWSHGSLPCESSDGHSVGNMSLSL